MQRHIGSLEIMCHTGYSFGSYHIYIGVVNLVLSQLAIDKSLSNVKHHTIFERTMTLNPPRVLIVPHINTLSMPGLKITLGIPTGNIHIMHTTIVESRTFIFVSFTRHQTRSHMTNTQNSQIPYFTCLNKLLDRIMVPGITQIKINSRKLVIILNHIHYFPLSINTICNRFFGNNMFALSNSFRYLILSGIGQCT